MAHRTDVTFWCRHDVLEVIRGFVRERGGLPVTVTEEAELTERLCERIGLEIRMHCDRQAWLVGNAAELGQGLGWASDPEGSSTGFDDDIPF